MIPECASTLRHFVTLLIDKHSFSLAKKDYDSTEYLFHLISDFIRSDELYKYLVWQELDELVQNKSVSLQEDTTLNHWDEDET